MVYKDSIRRMFGSITILAVVAVFAMIGCTGQDGEIGPTGPQGEQGPPGAEGPKGEEGTANVIYSDWININWNERNDANYKLMSIDETRVLDDFMDRGTLLMFLRVEVSGNVVITALPYTLGTDFISFGIVDAPDQDLFGIIISNEALDGSTADDLAGYQTRYILIPGGVPAKMRETFLMDYHTVKEYYGIKD